MYLSLGDTVQDLHLIAEALKLKLLLKDEFIESDLVLNGRKLLSDVLVEELQLKEDFVGQATGELHQLRCV